MSTHNTPSPPPPPPLTHTHTLTPTKSNRHHLQCEEQTLHRTHSSHSFKRKKHIHIK